MMYSEDGYVRYIRERFGGGIVLSLTWGGPITGGVSAAAMAVCVIIVTNVLEMAFKSVQRPSS